MPIESNSVRVSAIGTCSAVQFVSWSVTTTDRSSVVKTFCTAALKKTDSIVIAAVNQDALLVGGQRSRDVSLNADSPRCSLPDQLHAAIWASRSFVEGFKILPTPDLFVTFGVSHLIAT